MPIDMNKTKAPAVGTEETKSQVPDKSKPWREIVIKTDGDSIRLDKMDVSGRIELVAILQSILSHLTKNPNQNEL